MRIMTGQGADMGEENLKTILVVDDMAAILEHAKQLLKNSYNVIPCISADQALGVLERKIPDIIMADVNMPGTDGFEFLKKVREDDRLKDIKVLMTTAEITSEIESRGYELGADGFILKPFNQAVMLRKLSLFV